MSDDEHRNLEDEETGGALELEDTSGLELEETSEETAQTPAPSYGGDSVDMGPAPEDALPEDEFYAGEEDLTDTGMETADAEDFAGEAEGIEDIDAAAEVDIDVEDIPDAGDDTLDVGMDDAVVAAGAAGAAAAAGAAELAASGGGYDMDGGGEDSSAGRPANKGGRGKLVAFLVILLAAGGGGYYYTTMMSAPAPVPPMQAQTPVPDTAQDLPVPGETTVAAMDDSAIDDMLGLEPPPQPDPVIKDSDVSPPEDLADTMLEDPSADVSGAAEGTSFEDVLAGASTPEDGGVADEGMTLAEAQSAAPVPNGLKASSNETDGIPAETMMEDPASAPDMAAETATMLDEINEIPVETAPPTPAVAPEDVSASDATDEQVQTVSASAVEAPVEDSSSAMSSEDYTGQQPVRWPGEQDGVKAPEETTLADPVAQEEALAGETTEAERVLLESLQSGQAATATATPAPVDKRPGGAPADPAAKEAMVRPLPSAYLVVKKDYDSQSDTAQLQAAKRALDRGQPEAALEIFDDLYYKNPTDTNIMMARAVALQKAGRPYEAVQAYQTLLDLDPDNVGAMTNMMGLLRMDDPRAALDRLLLLWDAHPNSATIAGQVGITYGDLGQNSEALRFLNVAASLDPRSAKYPFNIAVILDRMGRKTEAREHYTEALQLDKGRGTVPLEAIKKRLSSL